MVQGVKISLFGNLILFLVKATALPFVNSLAILSDLGISCVALAISIILYYSIKLADKPADPFHNYGYSKVENVCEAMEGVVLIGIILAISVQAAMNFIHPKHTNMPWVGFICSIISVVINFIGAFYILGLAKKSSSPAIHAEGLHYRLEGFISLAIGISFIISIILRLNGLNKIDAFVDPVATLLVSFMLIFPSFNLARSAFFKLLDASIEESSKMEVIKLLGKYSHKYCDFRDLKSRSAGRKKFVELKLILPEDIPFKEGHALAIALEKDISRNISESEIMIKVEPCGKDCHYIQKNQRCPYL
ncbi:MAG: cation diffusion facilitator family transporter [Candidatus Omnitrophica bacterium]|nr:cation diffusion facilitator family transporter [Candidatus Omnitrophota bacterium]MBU1870471.1 cation diffusion facilitator family transporter [Candidatus Omnitrophota bacterium]